MNISEKTRQRYFIYLQYDGRAYQGWQIQPNGDSVQEEIQNARSLLLRAPIEIVGAGRTDAGVHASMMVAHFDFDFDLDCSQLVYRLNRLLPKDIAINSISPVDMNLHARFSARWRTYHYYIHTVKNPFLCAYSYELHYALDFAAMNEAASHLLQVKDFCAFCKSHSDVKTTICELKEARWVQDSENQWHFEITANRFLRNMVRAIVGTLIEVGRKRISVSEFDMIVAGRKRSAAGESMPGHALFLQGVEYLME